MVVQSKLPKSAHRAIRVVRFTPGITRADLARRLGVGVTTINPVVADLIDQGVLSETDGSRSGGSTVGRPRAGLEVTGKRDTLGTIIWSHGYLDTALATFENTIAWRERTAIESHPSGEEVIAAATKLFEAARAASTINEPYALVLGLPAPYERGVGVGGPAAADTAENQYGRWFDGDPLRILAERFKVPVLVENDANLGALGESRHGAGRGEKCVIYVKLSGHGIGSGITINGNLFSGSHGFAGEIAHVRVDDSSQIICVCGSRGCLEEKVGAAMIRPLRPTYGEDVTYDRLLELVDESAAGPIRILEDAGRTVGRALADMSTYFNPSLLVLDAGSPRASDVFRAGVEQQIGQSSPPFIRQTLRLASTAVGDDAPHLGAIEIARAASIGNLKKA